MSQLRNLVFQSDSPHEVVAEMDRLESLYFREVKRRLTVELYFGAWTAEPGNPKSRSRYGLTVYYKPEQHEQANWIAANIITYQLV